MKPCCAFRSVCIVAGTLVGAATFTATASAHRLDEYLQAARISVGRAAVRLDLSLAPGIEVAPGFVTAIDTNGDGIIAAPEAKAYAVRALNAMTLSLDGQALMLQLDSTDPVTLAALVSGDGALRLRADASLVAAASVGEHELRFENGFEPALSVYLGNAMLPDDPTIAITEQDHGTNQSTLTIRYRVREGAGATPWPWFAGAVALGGAGFLFARVIRRRPRP